MVKKVNLIEKVIFTQKCYNFNLNEFLIIAQEFKNNNSLWQTNQAEHFAKIFWEYQIKLHNFLTSYYTFYQICLPIIESQDDWFKQECDKKLEKFNLSKRSKFLIHLRTFVQHGNLPRYFAKWDFDNEKISKISIVEESLKHWKNWNSSDIDILDIILKTSSFEEFLYEFNEDYTKFVSWFILNVKE
ncbi:MAG: hypothetical protein PHP82_02080 [Candidatus ainarchaeum sp.]|nr:hypothetical protein [Candidatus ainarchaeum sp.]